MNITQKPGNKKIIFKKYIPQNMYQYRQLNYKEKENLNDYNNFEDNQENQEEDEQMDYNNEHNEEEEEYFEGEENREEEEEDNINNNDLIINSNYQKINDNENNYYNKEKQFYNYNNPEPENSKDIYQIENIPNNNNNNKNDLIIPKYYRNNPLIYKGNIPKRKIHRNLREENPLKSVAQKICNIVIKGNEPKEGKNKMKENSQKNFNTKGPEDNEEYFENEQYENEEEQSQNEEENNEEYEEINEEDEQGVEDIQDLEQEENEEFDDDEEEKINQNNIVKNEIVNKNDKNLDINTKEKEDLIAKNEKENKENKENNYKPIKIKVNEMQIKPLQIQNQIKIAEKPVINNAKDITKKIKNDKNNLKIKEIISKIKEQKPLTLNQKIEKIIKLKEKEPEHNIIEKNNYHLETKPIKVNIIKKEPEKPKEKNEKEKITKEINPLNKKQSTTPPKNNLNLPKNNKIPIKEKINDTHNVVNKSNINLKENKIINTPQKWKKIPEIKNIKQKIIQSKNIKESVPINSSARINKKYNTSVFISQNNNTKKVESNPPKKYFTNSYNTSGTSSKKNIHPIKKESINKINNISFGQNRQYKTLTYTSSKKDNLSKGGNGTSIIITSSKINDDKGDPSKRGRIQHLVTLRTFDNNRSNSTSKFNETKTNGKNSLNISNSKNRTVTIISSNENIEIQKERDINKTKEFQLYNYKNKNSNSGRNFISHFNLRNNYLNGNDKNNNKYIKTEPNVSQRSGFIKNIKKDEEQILGRNLVSPISKPNRSNKERKVYFSNNNNEKEINLNNKSAQNTSNSNINSNNNTVFISSYRTKRLTDADKNKSQENKNTNNSLYNTTNLIFNKNDINPENKIYIGTKEIKVNNSQKNKIYYNTENNGSNIISINSSKNNFEENKLINNEQNIKDVQSYLLKRTDDNKNPSILEISEQYTKSEINKNEENPDDIKTDPENSNLNEQDKNQFDFLKYSTPSDNNSNIAMNIEGKELYDKYDFLNTPGLSDYTKAYLTSKSSALRPELNAYTMAYLDSLGNDDNKEKPELTKLTKEYLSKNALLNDKKEGKTEENV